VGCSAGRKAVSQQSCGSLDGWIVRVDLAIFPGGRNLDVLAREKRVQKLEE
jgi:hypothetical protein